MKKNYIEPEALLLCLAADDVLTASGDNDAPFQLPDITEDDGWSGYY